MWPYLFGLRTYSFIYGAAILSLPVIARWLCRRRKMPGLLWLWLGLAFAFGMIPGAKLLYDLLHHNVAWRSYLDVSYYMAGGLWGGPLAYLAIAVLIAVCRPRDCRRRLDVAVLALPTPMILAKAACFANGCCYGTACDRPWAVTFPEGAIAPAGIARHPTELYEIAVLIVAAIVLAELNRERWSGRLIFWFVAIYGLGRPLTEVFRGDGERVPNLGPFTASQVVCLTGAAVAITLLILHSRRAATAA